MPRKHGKGRWHKSAEVLWGEWWTSGRAGLLNDGDLRQLEELVRLHDLGARRNWPIDMSRKVKALDAELRRRAAGEPEERDWEDLPVETRDGVPGKALVAKRRREANARERHADDPSHPVHKADPRARAEAELDALA
jgi:hypothetical protein